jgi:hypothetical protein
MFLAARATPQYRAVARQATRYDKTEDQLLVLEGKVWIPAIDAKEPPRTKKADIEKGEDQKDRWA